MVVAAYEIEEDFSRGMRNWDVHPAPRISNSTGAMRGYVRRRGSYGDY